MEFGKSLFGGLQLFVGGSRSFADSLWLFFHGLWLFAGCLWLFAGRLWSFLVFACFSNYGHWLVWWYFSNLFVVNEKHQKFRRGLSPRISNDFWSHWTKLNRDSNTIKCNTCAFRMIWLLQKTFLNIWVLRQGSEELGAGYSF